MKVDQNGAELETAGGRFRILPYQIERRTEGKWVNAAVYPSPTLAVVRSLRGPDMELGEGIISRIGTAVSTGDRIWFGLHMYDSEGLTGVGGIGFFDPATGRIGLLRHPRLLDRAVNSMAVTAARINLVIEEPCEGSCDDGEEISIDRGTLEVVGGMPGGNAGWSEEQRAAIRRDGAEAFMLAAFDREERMRTEGFEGANVVFEAPCVLTQGSPKCRIENEDHPMSVILTSFNHVASGYGCAPPAIFSVDVHMSLPQIDGRTYLEVGTPGRTVWTPNSGGNPLPAKQGLILSTEDGQYRLEAELIEYTLVEVQCRHYRPPDMSGPAMSSMRFQVRLKQLR